MQKSIGCSLKIKNLSICGGKNEPLRNEQKNSKRMNKPILFWQVNARQGLVWIAAPGSEALSLQPRRKLLGLMLEPLTKPTRRDKVVTVTVARTKLGGLTLKPRRILPWWDDEPPPYWAVLANKGLRAENERLHIELRAAQAGLGLQETIERLRAALEAVLIFHSGSGRPWYEDVERWTEITGVGDATPKILCDHIRAALLRGKNDRHS
jgi:hypothetical protein